MEAGSASAGEMAPGEVLVLCEDVLKKYDPLKTTLDAHAEAFLSSRRVGEPTREFTRQVLYGCVRYKPALKALLTSFYFNHGATTSRADYTKYLVLAYLGLFRLEELGFKAFARLVRAQPAEKMHVFLTYLFSREQLETWVKDEWIKHYDLGFVEKTLIDGQQRFAAQAEALCQELGAEAFGVQQARSTEGTTSGIPAVLSKPPTIPKPFNITPARPVVVPEPEAIRQEIVAKPMPKHLADTTLAQIEAERERAREEARRRIAEKYSESDAFQLHSTRDTLSKAVQEHEEQMQKALSQRFRAKPAPDFSEREAVVKLNTAAVLREDAVYKKKQAQEARLLQAYEQELRDSTEFYEWHDRMKQEDEAEKLRMVERRRMASVQSQQQARLANLRRAEENRKVAAAMRQEGRHKQQRLRRQSEAVLSAKKRQVHEIQARKDLPSAEKAKVVQRNRAISKQVKETQKELEARKRREAEAEQRKRNDLIRRIRALERVPTKRVTQFDPTESGGHGLLEEMSLTELKERLAMNEIAETKRNRELRQRILQRRVEKEKAMEARIQVIQRARTAAAAANRQTRQLIRERDAERQRLEQEVKDEAKIKLVEKLARVREQRESEIRSLQEEEEKLRKRNLFLGAAKEMVEGKMHQEFLKGAERKARVTQQRAQTEARAQEQINEREEAIRRDHRARQAALKAAAEARAEAAFSLRQKKAKEKAHEHFKAKREHARATRRGAVAASPTSP